MYYTSTVRETVARYVFVISRDLQPFQHFLLSIQLNFLFQGPHRPSLSQTASSLILRRRQARCRKAASNINIKEERSSIDRDQWLICNAQQPYLTCGQNDKNDIRAKLLPNSSYQTGNRTAVDCAPDIAQLLAQIQTVV